MSSRTTLVTGATAAAREAAICALLAGIAEPAPAAILLEGLASGLDPFDTLPARASVQIVRIAPGCLCCSGNLTLRVTLNRLLRSGPAHLYISLANSAHLAQIEAFLSTPAYASWLSLAPTVHCDALPAQARSR